jgi:hypothetical protein
VWFFVCGFFLFLFLILKIIFFVLIFLMCGSLSTYKSWFLCGDTFFGRFFAEKKQIFNEKLKTCQKKTCHYEKTNFCVWTMIHILKKIKTKKIIFKIKNKNKKKPQTKNHTKK